MLKIFHWLDENLLLCLALFLIVFIPLWPKIPLIQPIPGYIVRIRLEDVVVAITAVVFLIQVFRKKVSLATPLTRPMLIYLVVGLLSLLSAFFTIRTLPLMTPHVMKAFLHLLRYLEYFAMFFFIWVAIKKPKHVRYFLAAFGVAIIGMTLYGIGQKYWQWPVYSTMRYEFSAGQPLELVTPESRVQSTFAGHYDFAIYLDLLLPVILVLLYTTKSKRQFLVLALIFSMALWDLIVSGLRIAFLSYVVMVGFMTLLFALRQKTLIRKIRWFTVRIFLVGGFTLLMLFLFGQNLFALVNHAVIGVLLPNSQNASVESSIISQYQLPVPKDQVEQYKQQGGTQPADLSGCAKEGEVSLCIRLESLWPQAIKGFRRQPLLGSGYSSLNKRDFNHLSEADGTDNNYLRLLGETGLLGFLAFLSIIGVAVSIAFQQLRTQKEFSFWPIAYLTVVLGVLINAFLFDVFAASKVAFGFWAVTGVYLGAWKLREK